ncbi:MAG: AtpZ/AtpI family protein [Candidatus Omnitrophica bacterium]|nr:AtpZ/AtpI family protein [Candidatus Omnitrophota bacterium]
MKGKKKKSIWEMTQIAGLAVSVPFELLAGPFIGYLIGSYLKNSFGAHQYVVLIFVLMGIISSMYSVGVIIRMMLKIGKDDAES